MGGIKCVGIIGGGLSGLAAGVALSRRGFEVKLFEANDKVGGCCGNTHVEGYSFNDGALYLALPEILDAAFARMGLNRAATVPLRRIVASQTTRLPDGTTVSFGRGREVRAFDANGNPRCENLGSEIELFLKKWQPVLDLFAKELITQPFSLSTLALKGWRHLHKFRGTVASELQRAFRDPAVRSAMSGVLLYTGVPPEKAPIFQIMGLVALLADGFYIPEGGMGAIPYMLSRAMRGLGGEIFTGAQVQKIRIANGRVCGLDVEGHGAVELDAVISTASGMLTFGSLLDAEHVPRSMREKVATAPLSHRGIGIQLGLANLIDAPSHSMSVLPMMEEQYKLFQPAGGEVKWINYSVPTVTIPELAPPGGSVVEMFPPIDQSWPLERWDESAKEAATESAISALAGVHKIDVAVKRVITPKDYRDRMHLYQGALYGLSPAADPKAQFPHKTPVEGLFQAGQTTYPGFGVGTSALSGVFAAEALVQSARR